MTSSTGRPTSDSVNLGSNPSSPATGNADVSGISRVLTDAEFSEIAEQIAHIGSTKPGTASKRKGTPPPTKGKGKCIAFLRSLIGHQGDECVPWPFSRDDRGYGHLGFEGKQYKAHRLMCALVNGPPPTRKHQAAHSCGKGHEGCVNPNHLSWKTMRENAADMVAHGTARFGPGRSRYKLTEEQVGEILALKGKMTQRAIAAIYGVKDKQISKIHLGQAWPGGKKVKVGFKPGIGNPSARRRVAA